MNVFNSLGSNYNFGFVMKALFANNETRYLEELKKLLQKRYGGKALLFYKGRQALEEALRILDLPKDAEIAFNGFTCFAVYGAIENANYTPVCIDLDKNGLNFSAKTLQENLSKNPKIKVVVIQNTLGDPCDIEEIVKICKKHNLILIEDLAHCVGTKYANGQEAGTIGDFVMLSFSQDKIIDAVSGGALVIRNKQYQNVKYFAPTTTINPRQQFLDKIYPLLTWKIRTTYPLGIGKIIHKFLKTFGLLSDVMNENFYKTYSLSAWYANLVIYNFNNLKNNLAHRQKIAAIYARNLQQKIIPGSASLRFSILVEKRKELIAYLKKQGVYVADTWYDDVSKDCPNAQITSSKILNLPTHLNVSEKQAEQIAGLIKLWTNSQ